MSLKDEKSALRTHFRDQRRKFAQDGEAAAAAEKAIHENLRRWKRDLAAQMEQICAYRPLPPEVDPCVQPLTELFFPRIEGKTIQFYRPLKADAFVANKFQILEPIPEESVPLDASQPPLVLCPALAVDSLGRRIGNGAGHYDRFFQAHPQAIRVGVVYHVQVSQNPLPLEGWDQPLDWIITEKMILRVSRRSS